MPDCCISKVISNTIVTSFKLDALFMFVRTNTNIMSIKGSVIVRMKIRRLNMCSILAEDDFIKEAELKNNITSFSIEVFVDDIV